MNECKSELAVVIPVYNEGEVIRDVLSQWVRTLEQIGAGYEIHIYNDGSTDNTLVVLHETAREYGRILVHDKVNSGHGPTVLEAYKQHCDKKWIFQVDSDDEISPEYFRDLWENRNNFDFLAGYRQERRSHLSRKIISSIAGLVVRFFYGSGLRDVNVPYRLFRTEFFRDCFAQIPPDVFAPNIILAGVACLKRARIYQRPVAYRYRRHGEVSIKKFKLFKAAVRSLWQTLCFRFR